MDDQPLPFYPPSHKVWKREYKIRLLLSVHLCHLQMSKGPSRINLTTVSIILTLLVFWGPPRPLTRIDLPTTNYENNQHFWNSYEMTCYLIKENVFNSGRPLRTCHHISKKNIFTYHGLTLPKGVQKMPVLDTISLWKIRSCLIVCLILTQGSFTRAGYVL